MSNPNIFPPDSKQEKQKTVENKERLPGTIESLLEVDFYKITMLYAFWKEHRDAEVTFAFKNRTKKVELPKHVDEEKLRSRLDHIKGLRFKDTEVGYITDSFKKKFDIDLEPEFVETLKNFNMAQYELENTGDSYKIEVTGKWGDVTLWETLILSAVNEMYFDAIMSEQGVSKEKVWAEGDRRLSEKIDRINDLVAKDPKYKRLKIMEFGNRRAFSRDWQRHTVERISKELPDNFVGTSNVLLAKELGLDALGTFAHESYMGLYGVFKSRGHLDPVLASHLGSLEIQHRVYGGKLGIALTDNYGSDFFFKNFPLELAKEYKGLRHDSGDAFEFGEKAIKFYEDNGIDPKTKTLVFSDGLDLDKIIEIFDRFDGRVNLVFGWGTNLTNDMGFDALSLVAKLIRANKHGTVKLSDNFAKATGEPEDIKCVIERTGHDNSFEEKCTY
ncbi:MAG: nicotinate phosphoribosyltransferase [Candidatus Vogelbacteria bacterium]|nr:nicotinate phosphoribosyltransferase [Candidatus Vogelbacteria bacterium]